MWGMKTKTIPVVVGALGLIKKGLQKHMEIFHGTININELQKITLLGTSQYQGRFCLKSKSHQPCCAIGPWFGPNPLGVYSRLNSKNPHNNNNNNNRNYYSYHHQYHWKYMLLLKCSKIYIIYFNSN